ncbi:MAG TPA: hypothetical protein VEB64_09145 [Azospirillaceae bacterium]|nr:hypothetical protein [Azospirillaceae bacterium]
MTAMSQTDRAAALLDVMGRLSILFDDEVHLVRRQQRREVNELEPQKQALARAYEELARALRVDGEGLAELSPELRDRITATTRSLGEACRRNLVVLKAHSDVHRGVVDAIVKAFNQDRQHETGYAKRRGGAAPAGFPRGGAPATTLDTRL